MVNTKYNQRENMIELIKGAICYQPGFAKIVGAKEIENIADYILANGARLNGETYEFIDKFIESKVLDGKDYPTAKLYYEDYQKELERLYNGVTVQENTEISEELLKQLRNSPVTILQGEPTIEVVQEWISVKDRLPEECPHPYDDITKAVLIYTPVDGYKHIGWYAGKDYRGRDVWKTLSAMRSYQTCTKKVSHWAYLLESPKQ